MASIIRPAAALAAAGAALVLIAGCDGQGWTPTTPSGSRATAATPSVPAPVPVPVPAGGGSGGNGGGGVADAPPSALVSTAADVRDDRVMYRETWRPQFHYSPPYGWMNDPNGMVYSRGAFHLFFQFNPYATSFGNIGWGHAVGADALHWQHWPVAIPADPVRQVFSGSVVIDDRNTSGLCLPRANPEDPDCLVAIFTSNRPQPGRPATQAQDLAVSTDGGRSWVPFLGNPVLDENRFDFRDPKVIWHGPTQRWIMLLALPLERRIAFYASRDLRAWQRVGEFGPAGATGGVWECPDLFSLPVDGDRSKWKWVLKVDLNPGHVAGGSGGQYFVGEFDGSRFVAEGQTTQPRWLDGGRDFYCATHWHYAPGALPDMTWIGWMNNWNYASDLPTFPWRGTMTLPRRLGLRSSGTGPRLVQQPIDAVTTLRGAVRRYAPTSAEALNSRFAAENADLTTFEMQLTLRPRSAAGPGGTRAGLRLLSRSDRRVAAVLSYDAARGQLSLERVADGHPRLPEAYYGAHSVAVPLADGAARLRVFVDRNAIEVFADDGAAVITDLVYPLGGLGGVEFFAEPGVESIAADVWPLASIW